VESSPILVWSDLLVRDDLAHAGLQERAIALLEGVLGPERSARLWPPAPPDEGRS
jgi:hypothetical protein